MKTHPKITLILFVLIAVISLYFFYKTTSGRVISMGIKLNTQGLILKDVYSIVNGTNRTDWVDTESEEIKLFIGRTQPQDSKKYVTDKIYSLMALYEPNKSPYPEVITNIIDCSQEFKPVQENSSTGTIYKLFAGERYGYGVCSNDLVKYKALYGIFDCGKKGVFEVRLFDQQDIQKIQGIMDSFRCNN